MKIIADKRIPGLVESLEQRGHEVVALEGTEIDSDRVRDAEILFVRTRTRCDSQLLAGSAVRLLGTATIGTDHIDLDWCAANGIRTVSAPGCNAPAVMQYVASSLHAAGFDPAVHTLGVVGKGNIGSLVVDLYRAAGARVLVSDPPRKEAGVADEQYLPLQEVLSRCDAVTFHVPYTESGLHPTRHLLKGTLPENLKIIVNASRGLVIDPVLISGERRFIIDTWPFEDEPASWDATERKRLIDAAFIATPHIAGYSIEGKRRATEAMLAALDAYSAFPASPGSKEDKVLPRFENMEEVIASFNPIPLSEALKRSPQDFERLRASHLRPEPKPSTR